MSKQTDLEALAPCPFCGGKVKEPTVNDVRSIGPKQWWVKFYHDGSACVGRLTFQVRVSGKTKEEALPKALKAWNRRAILARASSEEPSAEALREALKATYDALIWCSGSALPEMGFEKIVRPAIKKAGRALSPAAPPVQTRAERKAADEAMSDDEYELRKFIAFAHADGKCHIYGDDGELQCNDMLRHGRTIDFRREPIPALLEVIYKTRLKEYAESQKAPPVQEKRWRHGMDCQTHKE